LVYAIPATANFTTEWIKTYKADNVLTFDILPSGLNGTATIKIEHSRNQTNYYDLILSSGTVASIGLTSSNEDSCFTIQNYPYGYIRLKYTNGTNSTGTIKILMEK
jgi:hypothetical protein